MPGGTESFGALLRQARRAAGLTQKQLAERSGVSEREISDQERGLRRSARNDTVQALAPVLRLTGAELERFERAGRGEDEPAGGLVFAELVIPPTPLIGRQDLLRRATRKLVQPGARIVTLTGPGGVGKTRLAAEAARLAAAAFPDGVHDVDLAVLREPDQVAVHIGHALGAQRVTDARSLAAYIGAQRMLVLLDNFEHLLPAATVVSQLVARCPGLLVLCTSRAPLRIRGEHEVLVPPLTVPAGEAATAADVAACAAAELFAWHAEAVRDWQLTDANARAVATICRRLDGMPLAIELAAAGTRALSVSAIAQRLEDRLGALDLLTDGHRDAPERQRTLSAAIAWSHDLLPADLQGLLRRLSVFPADWAGEAAEEVAGVPGVTVLAGVAALVASNLVVAVPPDRFRMYETVREFAAARLAQDGQTAAAEARHTAYVLRLTERALAELTGPDQRAWLDTLEAAHDDVRAALGRALRDGDQAVAVRVAGAMWRFWYSRGHLAEGDRWLDLALRAGDQDPQDPEQARYLARALSGRGATSQHVHNDPRTPRECYERAQVLLRRIGDDRGAAAICGNLALLHQFYWDPADSERLYHEAIVSSRACGDEHGVGAATSNLGTLLVAQGRHAEAEQAFARALAVFRDCGDAAGEAYTLVGQASLATATGRPAEAAALAGASRALFSELGDPVGSTEALLALAKAQAAQGQDAAAGAVFGEALTAARAMEDEWNGGAALRGLAELAIRRGDLAAGRDLAGQARDCYQAVGYAHGVASVQALLDGIGEPG
jgi:predicted ATPase/transcriptional regulator with XRE-family HTH domain